MNIRKQVYELTVEDLRKCPAWEFALDEESEEGQDEATVRPCQNSSAIDPTAGMFIVLAAFTLADGTKMQGYLTPPVERDRGDLGIIQPTIITAYGQIGFWYGLTPPDSKLLARN